MALQLRMSGLMFGVTQKQSIHTWPNMWIMYQYTGTSKLQPPCISLINKLLIKLTHSLFFSFLWSIRLHSPDLVVLQGTVTIGDEMAYLLWLTTSQVDMLLAVAQTCSCCIICCSVAAVVGDYMRNLSWDAASSAAAACRLFGCYPATHDTCCRLHRHCASGPVTLLDVETLLLCEHGHALSHLL